MTKQEQTKQMLKILCDKFQCSAIDRSYMAKSCKQCEDIVEALHEAGYGNISEYKAEREMLGSQIKVLKQRLNNKYIEIDNLNRDYSNSFERLKAQEREIQALREDNIDLKEELYELHDELDIARATEDITTKQAQIDVLKKLRSRVSDKEALIQSYIADSCLTIEDMYTEIDELLAEVRNEQ